MSVMQNCHCVICQARKNRRRGMPPALLVSNQDTKRGDSFTDLYVSRKRPRGPRGGPLVSKCHTEGGGRRVAASPQVCSFHLWVINSHAELVIRTPRGHRDTFCIGTHLPSCHSGWISRHGDSAPRHTLLCPSDLNLKSQVGLCQPLACIQHA